MNCPKCRQYLPECRNKATVYCPKCGFTGPALTGIYRENGSCGRLSSVWDRQHDATQKAVSA